MAIIDAVLEFSDAQALSSVASSDVKSTNVVDLYTHVNGLPAHDSITPDIGQGGMLKLNVGVNVALVGAGVSLACKLVSKASSASISSSGVECAQVIIPPVTAAGQKFSVGVPSNTISRYLGIMYESVGGTLTSATIDAWLSMDNL